MMWYVLWKTACSAWPAATGKYESYGACWGSAAAPAHWSCAECSWAAAAPAPAAPLRLDWLDVEMGDMLSSVSVGVARPSYDADDVPGLFPLLETT